MPSFADLQRGYGNLWESARLTREADAEKAAARIIANKGHYKEVENQTGVPWFWIGCIHMRESALDFAGALHNGDRIIGNGRKTTRVPAGRGPFDTWQDSAVDAFELQGLNKISEWTIERCLYQFEAYNGWGYFGRVASPYVWAGTQHYTRGKYVADHKYDPNHVDRQLGCAAMLKALIEADSEVYHYLFGGFDLPDETPPTAPAPPPIGKAGQGHVLTPETIEWLRAAPAGAEISVCVNLKKNGPTGPFSPADAGQSQDVKGSIMNGLTLPNKKTYGVAIIVAFIGIAEGLFGWDIPGVTVGEDWMQYILTGAGLGSVRAAIGKLIDSITGK